MLHESRPSGPWLIFDVSQKNMPTQRQRAAHLRAVAEALSACQLIEQVLKVYIGESFSKIKSIVAGRVPFQFSANDYEQAAMDKLLQVFRRLSDHDALIKRLTQFKKERDFIAHRAVMEYVIGSEATLRQRREMRKRLRKIEDEGHVLLKELFVELRRVKVAMPPALIDPYANSGRRIG